MRKFLFTISLVLIARIACSTELYWQVNPNDFEHSMSVTASIFIDDVEQQNEMLELGAFCGDELRACALPRISAVTDKYIYNITIYGNEDGERLNFKFYDHSTNSLTELVCSQTLEFAVNGIAGDAINPYIVIFTEPNLTFTGSGSWNDASNWENSKIPTETDDVVINGDAVIYEEVAVNSLTINETKSLTIKDGGVLTVNETLTNADVNALIIEDGGQIYQNNDNVSATFKKNIVNPSEQWGELDESGWQFITSPMSNSMVSDFAPESGDYDLFRYDGTAEYQWYNFKKSVKYTFDNDFQGWISKDADGDGFNWEIGDGYVYSASYDIDNDEVLAPDNYLVSPLINIDETGSIFKFKACAEDDYYHEYCGVFVSEDGVNFTAVKGASWWIGEGLYEGEMSEWYHKTVDLGEYAGKEIYVAIRHYNIEGSYNLLIDDIEFCRDGGTFENGIAYLASYETETTAEFTGILNKENSYKVTTFYSSSNLMANYNLVGNPFTYNINWTTDVKLTGVNDGYAVVKEDGGYEYRTGGVIKVGEGFMVNSAKGRNHNITFQKNINSVKRDSDNHINIEASSKYGSDNVVIYFSEEDNRAFPKLNNFNRKIANIYVKNNDTVYGIYNYNNDVTEIPLYFDAKEMGTYTLTFDVKGDYENLYLLDKMTGEKINLLLENEYEFMANSNDNAERFIIKMDNSQQSTDNSHFAYVSGEELIINAEGTIQIIDMMGRMIYSNNVESSNNRINVSDFNRATYVVRVINENGVKVQKMIL